MFSGRPVESSPSVALEKGSYRLPGSRRSRPILARLDVGAAQAYRPVHNPNRPSKSRTSSTASITAENAIRYDRKMVSLLVLVAFAMVACFGSAWWLALHGQRGTLHY